MVDLPTVPQPQLFRRGGTLEAPQSSLTAADVQSPFRQLAFAFDSAGDVLNTAAKRFAKEAGTRAVSRDESGNLQVEQYPIAGEAAGVYARAVKVGALAEGVGETKRAVLGLRQQFEGDPDGFVKAVEAYKGEQVSQFGKIAGPEVGTVIGRVIESTATLTYRSLLNAKRSADTKAAAKRIVSQADSYSDDIVALAENGATDTPEFQSSMMDYQQLLKEGADNPLVPLSAADAERHIEDTTRRARKAAFVGKVRQSYENGGVEEARGFADAALEAPNWSPSERAELAARSEDEVNALERKAENEAIAKARAPLVHSDLRTREGVARLADGSMSPGWVERHADALGIENADRFRTALTSPGAAATVPVVGENLTAAALNNPQDAGLDAVDALNAGQISRNDFQGVLRLAAQVENDAANRPWANDLRRDVLTRQPSALPEVSAMLASIPPETTQAQADEAVDAIVGRYATTERRQKVAALPLPRFTAVGRNVMEGRDVEASHAKTMEAARAGQLGFSDFVKQAALLDEWRDAVAKEA